MKQLFLSVLRFCAGLAAVGLAALALMALLGFAVPAFDLINHFQALLFLGLVVSLILCIWLVRGKYRQLVLMIAGAGFVASAVVVVPEIVSGFPSRPPAPHDRPTITLLTHNLFGLNYDMKRVEAIIVSEDPDILAFQEYFPEQFGDLDPLIRVRYPYSTRCRGGKRANLGLYSKTPFVEEEAASACPDDAFGTQRTAQILAEFELADGRRFSVLTTHLDWPLPLERQRTQMAELVGTLEDIKGPLLVVGDFNSTPWSYALRHFQSATELQRFTRNLVTFPLRFTFRGLIDTLPFLPLDHVFGRGVEVHDLYAGAETGSDHLPVIVKFSVE